MRECAYESVYDGQKWYDGENKKKHRERERKERMHPRNTTNTPNFIWTLWSHNKAHNKTAVYMRQQFKLNFGAGSFFPMWVCVCVFLVHLVWRKFNNLMIFTVCFITYTKISSGIRGANSLTRCICMHKYILFHSIPFTQNMFGAECLQGLQNYSWPESNWWRVKMTNQRWSFIISQWFYNDFMAQN